MMGQFSESLQFQLEGKAGVSNLAVRSKYKAVRAFCGFWIGIL